VFKDKANASTLRKYVSLFPGLGPSAGYKILQRMYKFGGQPFVNDYLKKHHKDTFVQLGGEKSSKTLMQATAGSIIGIGEVVLLPLDALKIKMQIQGDAYKGKGAFDILRMEGLSLYRGWGWTAARNAPGSFALFGASSFMQNYVFELEDGQKATLLQTFLSSIAGAVSSIAISAPLDVIKTRIQARSAANAESGVTIIKQMIVKEGFSSFFKVSFE
jgi:hypothetical protein